MKIVLRKQSRYAVLIPSKGRPDVLATTLEKQSFLNRRSTFVAVQEDEWRAYRFVRKHFAAISWLSFPNPHQSGCAAREELRKAAVSVGFKRYVPTDDNARYTENSLETLVRASFVYPTQPCIVAGFHSTAPHFDAGRIKNAEEHSGLHFYKKWGAIFWAIPHVVFSRMSYPVDGGRMDDRFVSFAALRQGVTTWVVCMEAPFNKPTQQKGGYSAAGRTKAMGQSIVRLATDYPEYMEKIVVAFPWARLVASAESNSRREAS